MAFASDLELLSNTGATHAHGHTHTPSLCGNTDISVGWRPGLELQMWRWEPAARMIWKARTSTIT